LSPRFIEPFKILARVGEVAYILELPEELSNIHPTFHVSHLRKCLAGEDTHVPLDDIQIVKGLNELCRDSNSNTRSKGEEAKEQSNKTGKSAMDAQERIGGDMGD
jgi:hypothetical protein